MADVDKENLPLSSESAANSKRPSASKPVDDSPSPLSTKEPTEIAALAFPVSEPDQHPDELARDGKTLRKKRSVLFYPSAGLASKSNQQPFSRSAAKRDSIMALGSIGYLQHLYTKQGIANRKRPMTKGAMTLAIGAAGEAMVSGSAGSSSAGSPTAATPTGQWTSSQITEEDEQFSSPPSPEAGSYTRPKYLDVAKSLQADSQALRTLLIADLDRLSTVWDLSDWIAENEAVSAIRQMLSEGSELSSARTTEHASVHLPDMIDATTKAIRSVRSYVLSLPQRSRTPGTTSNEPSGRDRFKRQSSFSGIVRPGQTSSPVSMNSSENLHQDGALGERSSSRPRLGRHLSGSHAEVDEDDLGSIRKSALQMLSALHDMEERNRTEVLGSSEGDALDTSAGVNADPDESRTSGLAKFTSGASYLYRSDLTLADLAAERGILQSYLETADSVISALAVSRHGMRRRSSADVKGPRKAGVSITLTSPAPSIRVDSAPTDASSDSAWIDEGLSPAERIAEFMIDHCENLTGFTRRVERLQVARGDLEAFLPLLSDGYLLCQAFNEAVRRSDKPWGYISPREMHDLEAEEAALSHKESLRIRDAKQAESLNFQTRRQGGASEDGPNANDEQSSSISVENVNRPGWTFRRTENLRLWATALKLRYQIQTTATRASITKPNEISGPTYRSLGLGKLSLHGRRVASESHVVSSTSSKMIDFDPSRTARRDPGWQQALTILLLAWIDAVAQEQCLV
ncbi:hypothetical protein PHSY_004835 [Pseudozyma hubeiensis SY62]|uniref:Uncharacterized protein n=1 Tax=Pseudozyma hubeiensis (strain SY62) TaxID=1305764 RepID=R9PGM7_PSEHS|nr:hypothetical protein PHSY_004835 [Pseudozyma hubeiensis SY62]GAC97250.1 hypothetical protein PHSY_004835 [Pseudozyma hubeiensis SY62]